MPNVTFIVFTILHPQPQTPISGEILKWAKAEGNGKRKQSLPFTTVKQEDIDLHNYIFK